jgi:predicted MPP superfamily phosphohydrolase
VSLKSSKVPAALSRLRIVQITDVHLGLLVRETRLGRILQTVRQANPDILVSTGDLVDGQIDNMASLASMFQEIRPKYGKFAVTGNHEYYAGIDRSLAFKRDAGFTVLRGSGAEIAGFIALAGVDDPAGRPYGDYAEISEEKLLRGYPRYHFTVLLKHRPVVDKEAIGLFDLQLSGHVHKGQIFPFVFAVRAFFPYVSGLYDFQQGSLLYVSRGSGTWGPPMRFLSPPEVTVIDVIPE